MVMLCGIIHGMDKFLLLFSAIALICMLAMMFFVSPSEIGPLGILTFFAMLYFVFVGLAVFGCRLFFTLRAKLDKTKRGNVQKKSYYYGVTIALAPVILLVCGSFGGVTLLEIGLVLALEIVMCFLVSRNIL